MHYQDTPEIGGLCWYLRGQVLQANYRNVTIITIMSDKTMQIGSYPLTFGMGDKLMQKIWELETRNQARNI